MTHGRIKSYIWKICLQGPWYSDDVISASTFESHFSHDQGKPQLPFENFQHCITFSYSMWSTKVSAFYDCILVTIAPWDSSIQPACPAPLSPGPKGLCTRSAMSTSPSPCDLLAVTCLLEIHQLRLPLISLSNIMGPMKILPAGFSLSLHAVWLPRVL